ncbi:hypothetical protein Tco_0815590 [Tanacetum coccineum]
MSKWNINWTRSCSDVVAFACVILSLLLEFLGQFMVCPIVNAPAGRLLGAYNLGVATSRAVVHAGDKTSGDARSWYMISGDAKLWVKRMIVKIMPPRMTTQSAGQELPTTRGRTGGAGPGRRGCKILEVDLVMDLTVELSSTHRPRILVGMSWEVFKTLTMEEFFPSNEMQKLEIKLWNHAMVGAGHAALKEDTAYQRLDFTRKCAFSLPNTAYPSSFIRPTLSSTGLVMPDKPRFIMDDQNITMEEYIRLEEEKAQRHGRTFNLQTATYGKMKYCEEEDDSFTNFETEYPAIVFDDTSDATLSCEPTVSPLNENEIDFRIPFDEFDDEDYMNDKVNTPSSPEPMISHCDDLDFFKVFENEFPAITYNDDLTSKLTEPSASFQHIKEFDLINKTSLSKYDEEELKVFNDSFPLNIFFPNNLKSKKDIDDDKIGVTQSSGRNAINIDTKGLDKLLKTGHDMAPLPSRDQNTIGSGSRGQALEKVTGVDLFYLRNMDRGTANVPYLLAQYLFRHAEGRKNGARLSGGHLIGCLASPLGSLAVSDQKIEGLSIEPERQPDAAAGAPTAAEDAPAFDKGAQADPAPVHAPQPPLPPGLYSRGFPSSRRRCRSYDGALWGCEEMLIYRSLIRAGLLPGWSSCMTQL